jgi:mobilome CxxCx(11)CxxC protein
VTPHSAAQVRHSSGSGICWPDSIRSTYCWFRFFERRARQLRSRRNWITFLGIAVPVTVGSLYLSFNAFPGVFPLILGVAGVILTIQLVMSVWSLVARWDEDYQHSIESMQANTRLFNAWKHEERTVALIQSGQTVAAIKFLREETGCSLALAKEMVEHMYGSIRRPLGPPCASCGSPLRTPRAKLCAECGARVDQ